MAAVQREATCVWQGELMKGEGTVNGGSGALSDPG
jgi:hypothetical protein